MLIRLVLYQRQLRQLRWLIGQDIHRDVSPIRNEDNTIVDLAGIEYRTNQDWFSSRSDRMAKYNQLLELRKSEKGLLSSEKAFKL